MLVLTVLAGLCGQLAGNVCFQWSLGVVGIALAVPITLGSMILTGAISGTVVLGDQVTLEMIYASIVLILAICILSLGAGKPMRQSERRNTRPGSRSRGAFWQRAFPVWPSAFWEWCCVTRRIATRPCHPCCSRWVWWACWCSEASLFRASLPDTLAGLPAATAGPRRGRPVQRVGFLGAE